MRLCMKVKSINACFCNSASVNNTNEALINHDTVAVLFCVCNVF